MGDLMKRIKHRYLTSGDFNGLYLSGTSGSDIAEAIDLVESGLVQVVSEQDYPNPHIRPWPSRRSPEDQIESLRILPESEYGLCLYPTPAGVVPTDIEGFGMDTPYRRALASGRGTLEPAYFDFELLEQYRNDPKFNFQFRDFGAETLLSDESHMTADEKDHIIMSHIGYAYDFGEDQLSDPEAKWDRYACAFLGDLAKLHPVHQARWNTFEVADSENLQPHPAWWSQQMGHWPDRNGPFSRFFFELEQWNEFHAVIYDRPIVKSTERPREFGWMIRPSQREFDAFILQLDQLLSDNFQHKALDDLDAERQDPDGNIIGTLGRLQTGLVRRGATEEEAAAIMNPFRKIRKLRQKPAHAPEPNKVDNTLLHQQVMILRDATAAVQGLRSFWQTHPKNRGWKEPQQMLQDPIRSNLKQGRAPA